ncbi:RNA polymerase II transcription mediator [Corchorus olitorius]|uniref:RNA polymerase II transcription mediator n=1 Tax=Corchorus olitorius TaxID=93759 RepID=A0A1R3J196_9ROSI|nr:RNA polymerase II transcription mediator [Corchorus olitorius]
MGNDEFVKACSKEVLRMRALNKYACDIADLPIIILQQAAAEANTSFLSG